MDFNTKNMSMALLFFIIGFVLFVSPIKDPQLMLTASIGLLGIVILFVPLIVEKQVAEKINSYLRKSWVEKEEMFLENTAVIEKEFNKRDKSKVNYKKIQVAAENLSDIVDSIGVYKEDLETATRSAIYVLLFVICLIIVDVGIGRQAFTFPQATIPITLSMVYSPVLMVGVYQFVRIILIWFEIAQKRD